MQGGVKAEFKGAFCLKGSAADGVGMGGSSVPGLFSSPPINKGGQGLFPQSMDTLVLHELLWEVERNLTRLEPLRLLHPTASHT